MHTTEKHHSADDRPLTDAELDQVTGAGVALEEFLNMAYNVGTVPYQTGKLGPGLHK